MDRGLGAFLLGLDRLGLRLGGLGLLLQNPHRQKLEDAVLDVTEGVVVLLEDLGRSLDVESLLGVLGPRQLADGLEVGANDLGLHALGPHALESVELAVDLLARRLRQLQCLELLA